MPARIAELAFWSGMLSEPAALLVDGSLDADRDIAGTAGQLTLTLPAAMTGALLTRVPAAFHGGINDVLLTGLVVAVAQWCRRRGRGGGTAVLLDLEGHGREEIFADVDLSRTVGWFTSLYPVRLDPGPLDLDEAMAGGPRWAARSSCIKEQLHAVPDHGLGYGLLRYLNAADGGAACRACAAAAWLQLSGPLRGCGGSGLGRRGRGRCARRRWRSGHAACPCARGQCADARWRPRAPRSAPPGRGRRRCSTRSRRCAIWRRAGSQALEALVRHAAQPGAGGRTPSDLPLVSLSQAEIERLEQRYPQIEDILPLSPLQEGLLFHALYDAQGPDVYTVQLVLGLEGRSTRRRCKAAVQALLAAPCQPARRLPAREPQPAGADHCAGAQRRRGAASICRRWTKRPAQQRLARHPGAGSRRALRSRFAAAAALHADPAWRGPAPAGAHQPSHPDGRLVDAGAGAGAARRFMRTGAMRRRCRG